MCNILKDSNIATKMGNNLATLPFYLILSMITLEMVSLTYTNIKFSYVKTKEGRTGTFLFNKCWKKMPMMHLLLPTEKEMFCQKTQYCDTRWEWCATNDPHQFSVVWNVCTDSSLFKETKDLLLKYILFFWSGILSK